MKFSCYNFQTPAEEKTEQAEQADEKEPIKENGSAEEKEEKEERVEDGEDSEGESSEEELGISSFISESLSSLVLLIVFRGVKTLR